MKKLMLTIFCLHFIACGSDDKKENQTNKGKVNNTKEIEVIGSWKGKGEEAKITESKWNKSEIIKFDNEKNFAITQNPSDDKYSPSKFNKLVWTEIKDNSFFYCTVDYGKNSAAEAEKTTKKADISDLEGKGCAGSFPWSKMTQN